MVSPDEDAEEADEQGGGDHDAVAEDFAAAEVAEEHGGEAHAGQDSDVDLRVAEKPEEMEPEERAAVAGGVEGSIDKIAEREEEAGAGVAVEEEEGERGEEDGEGDNGEHGGGEPRPDGEGESFPRHAGAAVGDDGGEQVDSSENGGKAEQA